MPKNLAALLRHKTIDKCLRNTGRRYSIYDLMYECGEALKSIDIYIEPAKRTIDEDINKMKNGLLGYEAPIENIRLPEPEYINGQKVTSYYRYSDPNFSIYNYTLPEEDLNRLRDSWFVLKQFKEFKFLSDVESIFSKLDAKIKSLSEKDLIGFQKVPGATGHRWIEPIYEAIKHKKVLRFEYAPFHKNEVLHCTSISPYYLKEFHDRWYFFGWNTFSKRASKIEPFGLDRITNLELMNADYKENETFDPTTYFEHIHGITNEESVQPQKIVLSFHHVRAKYVLTKPIHPSQKVIETNDQEIVIELFLKVNKELLQEVLRFGNHVKVISPVAFVKQVKKNIEDNLNQYSE